MDIAPAAYVKNDLCADLSWSFGGYWLAQRHGQDRRARDRRAGRPRWGTEAADRQIERRRVGIPRQKRRDQRSSATGRRSHEQSALRSPEPRPGAAGSIGDLNRPALLRWQRGNVNRRHRETRPCPKPGRAVAYAEGVKARLEADEPGNGVRHGG
jgi:hypothetical protein